MFVILGGVFIASLFGSLHCVGMCGPFALIASGGDSTHGRSTTLPTLAYSFGRLITYTLVGIIFGSLGLAVNQITGSQSGAFIHFQQSATLVAGILMITVGVVALLRYFGVRIPLPKFSGPLSRALQAGFKRTVRLPPIHRAFVIGLLTTLMPCGWLYTFALTAAGSASPLWGGAVMAVFWLGTVPIMAALMLGAKRIQHTFQKRIPLVMSLLVIFVGGNTIASRSTLAIASHETVVSGIEENLKRIENIDQEKLPCCCCEDSQED
ncbi:MAG: sulfite exporter TauE/SafE family protein [Pirellulaceae bacterium]